MVGYHVHWVTLFLDYATHRKMSVRKPLVDWVVDVVNKQVQVIQDRLLPDLYLNGKHVSTGAAADC